MHWICNRRTSQTKFDDQDFFYVVSNSQVNKINYFTRRVFNIETILWSMPIELFHVLFSEQFAFFMSKYIFLSILFIRRKRMVLEIKWSCFRKNSKKTMSLKIVWINDELHMYLYLVGGFRLLLEVALFSGILIVIWRSKKKKRKKRKKKRW